MIEFGAGGAVQNLGFRAFQSVGCASCGPVWVSQNVTGAQNDVP